MTRGRDSRGATTVELVVAMAIFAVLALLAAQAHITGAAAAGRAARSADRVAAVRLAQYTLEGQVRSGDAVLVEPSASTGCASSGGATNCIRVSTQYRGRVRCMQWQVLPDPGDPGRAFLRTRGWSPGWVTDLDVEAWRVPARGLAPASGAAQPFSVGTQGAGGSTVLQVRLVAPDPAGAFGPAVLATTLAPRNLLYRPASTGCSGAAP